MKKDKLYLFTFLSLLVVVYICGYFSMNYLVDLSTKQFLKIQIESSKREAKEMANLISFQAQQHNDRQLIINNVQKSIEKTDTQTGFICMFDHTGKEICHPNPEKIGRMTGPDESFVSNIHNSDVDPEDFYSYLKNKTEGGGLRNYSNPKRESEIIYLYPVKNTDWIVASHANLKNINKQVQDLKFYFILVYLSTGALIVMLSFFMVRLFGSRYERKLEQKNETLFNEVLNLSKLNSDLTNYKIKINASENTETPDVSAVSNKKRILTHLKNEIISLEIENIAYIYMENTITYVKDVNSKVSTSNSSLEEIYNELDNTSFFRANRQFIVSIKSIDKILKYGNNQLKIEVIPKSEIDIIISKNKAAEFKVWLNR